MTDDERDRIETNGSARWRAEAERTMGKLHDRLTRAELRVGEALGIGEDDGRIGKELDALRADAKAIAVETKRHSKFLALVAAAVVGSGGAAVQALRTSASEDGAALSRLATLERDIDRLEQSIRSLWTVTSPRPFRTTPTE